MDFYKTDWGQVLQHVEGEVSVVKAQAIIVKVEFSKDFKYLVFHLLKDHPFK